MLTVLLADWAVSVMWGPVADGEGAEAGGGTGLSALLIELQHHPRLWQHNKFLPPIMLVAMNKDKMLLFLCLPLCL